MRKAVTTVVATTLLILFTVAAAGSLYTYVKFAREKTTDGKEIPVNVGKLVIESCWVQSGDTKLRIRNSREGAINTSKINVFINGSIQQQSTDYTYSSTIVGSRSTFELNIIGQTLSRATSIKLSSGTQQKKYRCVT